ncbi:hypothetical protein DPMN_043439 [Dreissena polymorpha]|uniref:Uncharacterized protein n=1 Tax=Dreissena polymorpha TaxID=45954 RepID=A0A9D4D2T7_DREPO|nr:hypothetical protein DPMN_043439 [Dreissena polymorpha]
MRRGSDANQNSHLSGKKGSVEKSVNYQSATPTPVAWEAKPVQFQAVLHMSVYHLYAVA